MFYEVHQLEASDPDSRMFNRNVQIDVDEEGYRGQFAYEGFSLKTAAHPSVEDVLGDISIKLYRKGFVDIRTRVNFREERYLAEREPWTYYQAS